MAAETQLYKGRTWYILLRHDSKFQLYHQTSDSRWNNFTKEEIWLVFMDDTISNFCDLS